MIIQIARSPRSENAVDDEDLVLWPSRGFSSMSMELGLEVGSDPKALHKPG